MWPWLPYLVPNLTITPPHTLTPLSPEKSNYAMLLPSPSLPFPASYAHFIFIKWNFLPLIIFSSNNVFSTIDRKSQTLRSWRKSYDVSWLHQKTLTFQSKSLSIWQKGYALIICGQIALKRKHWDYVPSCLTDDRLIVWWKINYCVHVSNLQNLNNKNWYLIVEPFGVSSRCTALVWKIQLVSEIPWVSMANQFFTLK